MVRWKQNVCIGKGFRISDEVMVNFLAVNRYSNLAKQITRTFNDDSRKQVLMELRKQVAIWGKNSTKYNYLTVIIRSNRSKNFFS